MLLKIPIDFISVITKLIVGLVEHEFQLRSEKSINDTINTCKTIETVNKDSSVQNIDWKPPTASLLLLQFGCQTAGELQQAI